MTPRNILLNAIWVLVAYLAGEALAASCAEEIARYATQ